MAAAQRWAASTRLRRNLVAGTLLLPALVFGVGVVAYPLALEVWFSFSDASTGTNGDFIGLANYQFLFGQSTFRQILLNTAVYTIISTLAKALLGTAMALALARHFTGRRLVYTLLFLPFIFPVSLGTVAWYFLLSNVHGGIDYLLLGLHLTSQPVDFKGAGPLPMASVITVNVWHGTALFGVLMLAGLRAVPDDVLDAAAVDGAGAVQRFFNISLPLLRPALVLATVLSILGTFGDFAIVYLLTGGGPLERTEIISTFAYSNALVSGDVGLGAAVAMSIVPVYVAGLALLFNLLERR